MENHVLIPSLECAVPLHVLQIKKLGYLPAIPDGIQELIASHGDTLLFTDKREKKGAAAEIFNKLALTIAIMSFASDGIRVFGNHWQNKL
jgi:hypothetical protein